MTPQSNKDRDGFDATLSKALRAIRLEATLPEPGDSEPGDDDLLLLLEGKLVGDERDAVAAKVAGSPFSADRLAILREALAEADTPTRLSPDEAAEHSSSITRLVFAITKRGADHVLAFLHGTMSPMPLAPAAVATRGAEFHLADQFYRFEHRFGEWDALIRIEHLPARGVELRVDIKRGDDGATLEDTRASLRRGGKLIESLRVRDGVADFTDLKPARYRLELSGKAGSIGTLDLHLLEV